MADMMFLYEAFPPLKAVSRKSENLPGLELFSL